MNRRGFGVLSALVCSSFSCAVHAQRAKEPEHVFALDPVTDTVYTIGVLGVAATCEAFIATGEIEAQTPDDEAELIAIDAWVAKRDSARLRGAQASDIGALVLGAWAVVDTTRAGLGKREDSALTYFVLYTESAATTWFLSNLFKMAVRRPRPRAYIELRETGSVSPETQEALSFYSLHTALAATLGSTASYIAFAREAPVWERWLILGGSVAATSVVGVGRILSAAHFTTDVIGGLAAGVSVGVLVPHLHRVAPVQLSATPVEGGATVGVSGEW